MEIIAYGSPKADCRKCRQSEEMIEEVLGELGAADVTFLKLTLQDTRAAEQGVMVTPTIVVDDQIVADGKLPDREKFRSFLAAKLGG